MTFTSDLSGSLKAKSQWLVLGIIVWLAAVPVGYAASPYGNCDVLFATQEPPSVSGIAVTPLCEEDDNFVFFATGYSKSDNHGLWSAYRLDEDQVQLMIDNPLPRPRVQFRRNKQLVGGDYVQPVHGSYTGTNWDRGHLAPNGAMAWDEAAQRASFTVTNIAPQSPAMNRNIWRCFEVSIREWAAESKSTYVVVGAIGRGADPIIGSRDPREIPISVPTHFIAMIYRELPGADPIALGVQVPNTANQLDIREFMMSVSELEDKTHFKFGLPAIIANKSPDSTQWPTRIVRKELLGKLPDIDAQCPKVIN